MKEIETQHPPSCPEFCVPLLVSSMFRNRVVVFENRDIRYNPGPLNVSCCVCLHIYILYIPIYIQIHNIQRCGDLLFILKNPSFLAVY